MSEAVAATVEEIAKYACEKNLLVQKEALRLLSKARDYRRVIDELANENCDVVDEQSARNKIVQSETKLKPVVEVEIRKSSFRPLAKEIGPNCRVIGEYDVTGRESSRGSVGDFLNYFRDKYSALQAILSERANFHPKPISRVKAQPDNTNAELVGMVEKKWESKNGNTIIRLDDPEDACICVVSKMNKQLVELSKRVLLDDVIGIRGRKVSGDMIIADEILWPDLPNRPMKPAERELAVIATSDLHLGSKFFLEKEFDRFLAWVSGRADSEREQRDIGLIKYLVVCGDNVDGIGVYPDQYDELIVKDIYEQYELFCDRMLQIPEYIEVFICPGQHDAVRRADPQPAIPKEFVKRAAEMKNVHFVGSPSWLEIEGLKCLIYHGASLHDLYHSVDFLSNTRPQEAMAELLKHRDLMPGYGIRQPYVPEQKDFMVIREAPDFYFGGDMHHNGYMMYKNCLAVNAGTWQKQTAYQVKEGHVPTPGIVPYISLKERKITEINFLGG